MLFFSNLVLELCDLIKRVNWLKTSIVTSRVLSTMKLMRMILKNFFINHYLVKYVQQLQFNMKKEKSKKSNKIFCNDFGIGYFFYFLKPFTQTFILENFERAPVLN